MPLRMPSLLPHDLCPGRSSSHWPPAAGVPISFPHSSILAWRISWTEEPGGLQSIGLQRLGLKQLGIHAECKTREDRNEEKE